MTRIQVTILVALLFVPLVAWSQDAAVIVLALSAVAVFMSARDNLIHVAAPFFRSPAGILTSVTLVWAAVSFVWAPHISGLAWLQTAIVFVLASLVSSAINQSSPDSSNALARPILYAVFGLVAVLLIERVTDGFLVGLHRTGETTDQRFNVMNGGLVLLSGLTFSTVALLRIKTHAWRKPLIFLAAVFVLTASYRMDAVPVAIIGGALAYALVMRWHSPAFYLVTGGLALFALSWPVIAYFASTADLHVWFTETVHPNWGYRIAIWGRASELIRENVLVGYGFDASRYIGETAGLIPDAAGRTSFLHPHNGVLQVWLELGLVGIGLLTAAMVLGVRRLVQCAPNTEALAVAAGTITASATIWLLSFGIWQSWWLAVLSLNACVVVLVFKVMGNRSQDDTVVSD